MPTRKKIAQTDAIFDQLASEHAAAAADPTVVRISLDAKATIKIGPFSRRGCSRVLVRAADHDFPTRDQITPVGLCLPELDALYLYGVLSKVTSDCLVDCLEHWWAEHGPQFPQVRTLLLNLDNGPECHSHRTQFVKRIVGFAEGSGLTIKLAYYPPYHSKYNPVERCWGILENHWNGSLLDSVSTVLQYAKSMTWKGRHPIVTPITAPYHTGVKLLKSEMAVLETKIQRLATLDKWFVTIPSSTIV